MLTDNPLPKRGAPFPSEKAVSDAEAVDPAPEHAGSFGQVISRLLAGYNYVVKKDGETTEITVFGRRGEVAIPPPAPKAAPAGITSRWR